MEIEQASNSFLFFFFFQIVLKLTLVLLELYDILFPLYLFNE